MAKLQKSFEDYFRIPIQLRAVGNTPLKLVSQLEQALNSDQHQLILGDERYQRKPDDPHYQLLSNRNTLKDTSRMDAKQRAPISQKFHFKSRDFQNQWAEFQIIYRCKFVIGVVSLQGNQNEGEYMQEQISQQLQKIQAQKYSDALKKALEKLKKTLKEQNKKLTGVLFLNGNIRNLGTLEVLNGIISHEQRTLIPQSIPESELWTFLEPWLYFLLKKIETYLCEDISEYKNQASDDIVVFNKNQDKPDPKTVKKKKRGRYIKLAGDTYLMLKLYKEAYSAYSEAQQILKKVDDYLWLLGCCQGKMACLTCGYQIPQVQQNSQTFVQYMNESISLAKKIKIPAFQAQNYFKIFKIFTDQPKVLDQMVTNYLSEHLKSHVEEQQFNIYIHVANIYERAGYQRKRNYFYYLATLLYLQKKPEFSQILLKQIKQSFHIKSWPQIYAKLIKLIIGTHLETFNGKLQLELLQNCSFYLSPKDVKITIETLNFSHFQQITIDRSNEMVQILRFNPIQSSIKPKKNTVKDYFFPTQDSKLSNRRSKGYFMSWKKKQQRLLYQFNEQITLEGQFKNKMSFPVRMSIIIPINMGNGLTQVQQRQIYLQSNKISKFQVQIRLQDHSQIQSAKHEAKIQKQHEGQEPNALKLMPKQANHEGLSVDIPSIFCKIWNFKFTQKLLKPILLQLYEEIPQFQIYAPNEIIIQSSTKLQFPFSIKKFKKTQYENTQKTVFNNCELIKIDVCVYYTVDVGFQQTTFVGRNQDMRFLVKQNQEKERNEQKNNAELIYLKKFKAQRKYLKKIQICLQYAKSPTSKYQISKNFVITCKISNSISVNMLSYESQVLNSLFKKYVEFLQRKAPIQREHVKQNQDSQLKKMKAQFNKNLVKNQQQFDEQGWRIIEENLLVILQVTKQSQDKLPYKINLKTQQSSKTIQLNSENQANVMIQCQKSIKIEESTQNLQQGKFSSKGKVQIEWKCMAPLIQEKYGFFDYFLPIKYLKSTKKIQFKVQQLGQNRKPLVQSQQQQNLKKRTFQISYKIQCQPKEDISHKFIVLPMIAKQTKQYAIRGKHIVKGVCNILFENNLELSFNANYDQIYLLALVFNNSIEIYYNSTPIQLKSCYKDVYKIL